MTDKNNVQNINLNQDQLQKYTSSIENLKIAVNNLSQPFNSLSKSLDEFDKSPSDNSQAIRDAISKNNEFKESGVKMNDIVEEISSSFKVWQEIIKALQRPLLNWTNAISAGLTVLTVFGPELLKFAKSLFQGKDAVSAMAANFKNLNEVMKASNKDAATEITRLNVLYN